MFRFRRWATVGIVGVLALGMAFSAMACGAPSSDDTGEKPGTGQTTLPSQEPGGAAVSPSAPSMGMPAVMPETRTSGPISSEAGSGTSFAMPSRVMAAPDYAAYAAPQASPGSIQQEGIWVNGVGRVPVVPDLGVLQVRVEAQDKTVSAGRERAATAMRAILDAVKRQGLAEKDIQTQYFNIQPIYHWEEAVSKETGSRFGKQVLDGYMVNNSISVKVRDLAKFDEVIDSAVSAGGDLVRIDSVALTVEDSSRAMAEARTKAMKDAMAHAEQLAQAAGIALGQPVFISESGGYAPPPTPYLRAEMAYAKGADAGQATPIMAGEMEVTVSVQAIFAIL